MLRVGRQSVVVAPSALALSLLCAPASRAEERTPESAGTGSAKPSEDRFSVSARSETYLEVYRRALVPGPNGAVVPTETAAPVHEYLLASAKDVDTPWDVDSVDLEFAAWGRLWPTDTDLESTFDGDIQTASLRYRAGPAWVRLGRQQIAGGAARFARFDGVMLGAHHLGFFAEAYGGFTVLPRWNDRPGYHHLGPAEDELLLNPGAPPERPGYWLAGGRLGYGIARVSGSVSLHEERRSGDVDRRNLGVDVGGRLFDEASAGASLQVDLDSFSVADTRIFIDATPHPLLDVGAEFMRAVPGLLLSRQSVLSVFTDDGYDELGGTLSVRAQPWLRFDTNGYLVFYDGEGPGARGEIAARIATDRRAPTLARVAYARVIAPDNGYQSLRVSLSRQVTRRAFTTLEAYGYFYDEAMGGSSTSSLYSGTASYRVCDPLELMWSVSVAHSRYAALDAQTMLRATVELDLPRGGRK